MPTIGCRKTAALALAHHKGEYCDDFETAGSGAFRFAYLHKPTGVVYKVERNRFANGMGNSIEARKARALAKRDWTKVRIPKVSLFKFKGDDAHNFVLAMELVTGTLGYQFPKYYEHDGYVEWFARKTHHDPYDMHGKNFFIDEEGFFVPVDLGS